MSEALKSILAEFGFDIDTKKLEHAGKGIDELIEKAKQLGEVLAGGYLGEKVREFVTGQIEAGAQLLHTAERLGVTTDELQKFQLAANEAGVSSEEAATGLRFLNRNIGQASTGNAEAIKSFQALHIEFKNADGSARPLTDVVAELGDSLEGMHSQGERTAAVMKILGRGGAALLPLFKEGSKGIKQAAADFEELGGGMHEDFVKNAEEAERATVKYKFALKGLQSQIANGLIPVFTWLIEEGTNFVAALRTFDKHTHLLTSALKAMASGAVYMMVSRLFDLFGFGKAGILGVLKSLWKFAGPALVIYGLYLLFQDLWTMINGGDSLIGRIIDQLWGVGTTQKVVEDLKTAWSEMVEIWDNNESAVAGVAYTIGKVLVEAVLGAVTAVRVLFNSLQYVYGYLQKFEASADKLLGIKSKVTSEQADANIAAAAQGSGNALDALAKLHMGLWDKVGNAPGEEGSPNAAIPYRQVNGGGYNKAASQTNFVEIKVMGNADSKTAQAIGKSVRGAMNDQADPYAAIGGSDEAD